MYTQLLTACLIALVGVSSIPVPNNELDIVQVPLSNGKELDLLTMGDASQTLTERNKRTIGLLRELFPDITKQIDDQANIIISKVIRVLGPTVLRSAIQGNAGAGGGTASSAREDFDADFDDDDDTDKKDDDDSSSSGSSDTSTRVKIELPTFSPDSSENETDSTTKSSDSADKDAETKLNENSIDLAKLNEQLEETIRVARQAEANNKKSEQSLNEIGDIKSTTTQATTSSTSSNDQTGSESKSPALDELSLDSTEDLDADDRNKRFLTLGGQGGAQGNSAGSGNFLFDIIRRGTERALHTAGLMYEYVARPIRSALKRRSDTVQPYYYEKQSDIDFSTEHDTTTPDDYIGSTFPVEDNRLFSGSVQTQTTDESANSPSEDSDSESNGNRANDGYQEAIPGPVTRLVVLANRGLANLVQDLILRIAATSERLVNFKAKVITALI